MKLSILLTLAAAVDGLHMSKSKILAPFHEARAVKVISGLMNYDRASVARVCSAAEAGGASMVDIACNPELVKLAMSKTTLPICVSSVTPRDFVTAVEAGADMVEIGNYDAFYPQGITFSAEDVLRLAKATRELLPDTLLSVTVPHTLPMDQQVALAESLIEHDVNIIQTEGGTSTRPTSPGTLGMIEKAAPSLAAAHEISSCVGDRVFVMAASGITDVTAPLAVAAGAAGVGVGSAVNKLKDETAMAFAVRGIVDAIAKAPAKQGSMA